jgi:hypothetical protein
MPTKLAVGRQRDDSTTRVSLRDKANAYETEMLQFDSSEVSQTFALFTPPDCGSGRKTGGSAPKKRNRYDPSSDRGSGLTKEEK